MVEGQHIRRVSGKKVNGVARAAATLVLLLVIVGVVVLSTGPSGCQANHDSSIATTSDAEVQRALTQRATNGKVFEQVKIAGREFWLELAADHPTRLRGLGGVTEIARDGGMLFVFPDARGRAFVMRDCLVPIDILFLDKDGYITAMHTMPVEEPQGEDESDFEYEDRLTRYSSRLAAQFAIEIRGGLKDELKVNVGDRIPLDVARLKKLAR